MGLGGEDRPADLAEKHGVDQLAGKDQAADSEGVVDDGHCSSKDLRGRQVGTVLTGRATRWWSGAPDGNGQRAGDRQHLQPEGLDAGVAEVERRLRAGEVDRPCRVGGGVRSPQLRMSRAPSSAFLRWPFVRRPRFRGVLLGAGKPLRRPRMPWE